MSDDNKDDILFNEDEVITQCEICNCTIPDFIPEYCCSGLSNDCYCMGMPIEPAWCTECWDKVTKKGMTIDDVRAQLVNLEGK